MISPFWINAGSSGDVPKPKILDKEKKCIESKEYMRANHMQILNDWRDTVVREGISNYTAADGRVIRMSLQHTCMDCHKNKKEFCDKCHEYAGVTPYCWTCHIEPKEKI